MKSSVSHLSWSFQRYVFIHFACLESGYFKKFNFANVCTLPVPRPDEGGGEGWRQEGHPPLQNFAIFNHMDPSLGSMSITPFGYEVGELENIFKKFVEEYDKYMILLVLISSLLF